MVTPGVANFGRVKAGTEVIQKVQIRGQRPFRILGVDGADGSVRADLRFREDGIHSVLTLERGKKEK